MTLAAADTFLASSAVDAARNVAILLGVVFWLATVYWVYKDARRRIEDPWLVAMATVLGAIPPFLGPLIYMLFRPPEYLEDVRERELEMLAIEERLAEHDLRCPVCRGAVEASFLVCPVCTTRLKQACIECAAPLEPIWQVCPYCATPVPPGVVTGPIGAGTLNLPIPCARAKALATRPFKFTLTGPHMLAKTLHDRHYGSAEKLAHAIAGVLAEQVKRLDADVVQVDEANLPGHPQEWKWAAAAINKVRPAA